MVAQTRDGVRLFVYALCEPDGKTIRYIGLTGNLWKRYRDHFHSCIPAVKAWVSDLRSRGLIPSMIVLQEVVGVENGRQAESNAIREHKGRLGEQLLNETYIGLDVPRDRLGRVEFDGRKQTLSKWAKELGITRQALHFRLQRHPVSVALSRGKDQSKKLDGTPNGPKKAPIQFAPQVIEIDPRHCQSRGLTHSERRERRRAMFDAVQRGALVGDVALAYGVTYTTVSKAVEEFSGGRQ